jgi:hypothetical protein
MSCTSIIDPVVIPQVILREFAVSLMNQEQFYSAARHCPYGCTSTHLMTPQLQLLGRCRDLCRPQQRPNTRQESEIDTVASLAYQNVGLESSWTIARGGKGGFPFKHFVEPHASSKLDTPSFSTWMSVAPAPSRPRSLPSWSTTVLQLIGGFP